MYEHLDPLCEQGVQQQQQQQQQQDRTTWEQKDMSHSQRSICV